MTERINCLRNYIIVEKKHHAVRKPETEKHILADEFARENVPDADRAVARLRYVLEHEEAVLFPDERIALVRTLPTIPSLFTAEEMAALKQSYWIHEKGDVCNINVDYTLLLECGFDAKRSEIAENMARFEKQGDKRAIRYLQGMLDILDSVQALAERYRQKALECGNRTIAESFERIPKQAPRTFLEALQMFRLLHFTMWCGGNYHNTIGRFDQYMYKYLKRDMENGLLDYESALELLEEFFLTFNRDSDLYPGMQQGDNGQSMVLGGLNQDGSDGYNLLSELCLKASLELGLIDPKINLRVHKNTPVSVYELGTRLTKQGLGFPQYSNDDIVIPGLLDLGYLPRDAYNYVCAACWEFIIPGRAMDVPNIEALSFTKIVTEAVFGKLEECGTWEQFESCVTGEIHRQAQGICQRIKNLYLFPAPFLSLMMEDCVKNARDISLGAMYNNYGIHGTGIATAADSLAAVKLYVFDRQSVSKTELIHALKNDFKGHEQLLAMLRFDAPKMGNDNDAVDNICVKLLSDFADSLKSEVNDRGGIFRAGTGSAMYYLWHAADMPATPDGRRQGEAIPANYSPSLFSRCKGPVSIIKSFTKPDLKRVINGGPLTLELHDTVFRDNDSIAKVALLVKSFMDLGGHQLQLNAVNRGNMLDAQKHPENYRNLIVRVWGWSGYFVELDKEYQDHIIERMELIV